MLIDTHAHLFWENFQQDFNQVLKNAEDAGVTTIINVGVDISLSKIAAKMESPNSNITFYAAMAIHPEEAIKYLANEDQIEKDVKELEDLYHQYPHKIIAIGECGLDYSYLTREGYLTENQKPEQIKLLQKKLFQAQITLARKLNLPLLLHVRDDRSQNPELIECWDEVFQMAGDHFGILHCYSGLAETTKRALESNYLISFAGNLTYKKNEYLQESAKMLPLEKIVLETDCPFLAPQSKRGKRNEPANVKEIAQYIAELKEIPFEKIAEQTTKNVLNLFNLK